MMHGCKRRLCLILLCLVLLPLLTACDIGATSNSTASTATPQGTPATPVSQGQSTPAPQVQTSCPDANTARPAVMPALSLGQQQVLLYRRETVTGNNEALTYHNSLISYNVDTGIEKTILDLPGAMIRTTQLSADGQWIALGIQKSGVSMIQLVRIDGSYLQTLYCPRSATGGSVDLRNVSWSPDQHLLIYNAMWHTGNGGPAENNLYLLNLTQGTSTMLFKAGSGCGYYQARKWLSNKGVYLFFKDCAISSRTEDLALLPDVTLDPAQLQGTLQPVNFIPDLRSSLIISCDLSPDKTQWMYSSSASHGQQQLPKDVTQILLQPVDGSAPEQIYNNVDLPVKDVQYSSASTVLFTTNAATVDQNNAPVDHYSLWTMQPDGSSKTQILQAPENAALSLGLPLSPQWSTLSHDGHHYAILQTMSGEHIQHPTVLLLGALSGGSATTVASTEVGDRTDLYIMGWTTM